MPEFKVVLVLTILSADEYRSSIGSKELHLPFPPFKGLNFGFRFIDSLTEVTRVSWLVDKNYFRCEMKPIVEIGMGDLPSFEEYIETAIKEGWEHFDRVLDDSGEPNAY